MPKETSATKSLPPTFMVGEQEINVGRRLREIRTLRGLSLKALAELSGLNINTLSLIENERTSPSVSTLQQLAQSLQVSITQFFEVENQTQEIVHQTSLNRARIFVEQCIVEDLAAGMPHFGAEPMLVTLPPGASSGKSAIVHTGREFVYCIEGSIAYTVGEREYLLNPDDSLVFEAYLPHRVKNIGEKQARMLLVLCPTDAHDTPSGRHFSAKLTDSK